MDSPSPTSQPSNSQSSLPAADQLPPVQPPSAGFIMQLFLVPGLIVVVVVGVWALFGQISSSEQDWRELTSELRSTNDHRRWRGANALAQVLRADADLGDKGQHLASNPQIASELTKLLDELLAQSTSDPELITQQSFVARTLGWLDTEDITFPVLVKAMQPGREMLVRADAIRAIAQVAGRKSLAQSEIKSSEIADQIIEISRDENALIRQVCTFTLGLLSGPNVEQRLRVLAEDVDPNTRTNAAIALTRRGSTDGVVVLVDVLKSASQSINPADMVGPSEPEKRNQAVALQEVNAIAAFNAFKALRDLEPKLTASQRQAALAQCEVLAKESAFTRIRMDAELTARALRSKP